MIFLQNAGILGVLKKTQIANPRNTKPRIARTPCITLCWDCFIIMQKIVSAFSKLWFISSILIQIYCNKENYYRNEIYYIYEGEGVRFASISGNSTSNKKKKTRNFQDFEWRRKLQIWNWWGSVLDQFLVILAQIKKTRPRISRTLSREECCKFETNGGPFCTNFWFF